MYRINSGLLRKKKIIIGRCPNIEMFTVLWILYTQKILIKICRVFAHVSVRVLSLVNY